MKQHGEILYSKNGNTLEAAKKIFGKDHLGSKESIEKQRRRLLGYFHSDRLPENIKKEANEIFQWIQEANTRLTS